MTLKNKTPMKRTPMARGKGFQRALPGIDTKPAKGPKPKSCSNRACRAPYMPDPRDPRKKWCSDDCGAVVAMNLLAAKKAKEQRIERAADKVKLTAMKPLKWWRAKAKAAMHELVRAEAENQPCISCDTILRKLGRVGGDYDAGHFRSVGSAKNLEMDRRNVWGQCKYCNDHLSGNNQEYERRLRIKKGDAFVDAILSDNAPRHYKAHDYQALEEQFKAELKSLQNSK